MVAWNPSVAKKGKPWRGKKCCRTFWTFFLCAPGLLGKMPEDMVYSFFVDQWFRAKHNRTHLCILFFIVVRIRYTANRCCALLQKHPAQCGEWPQQREEQTDQEGDRCIIGVCSRQPLNVDIQHDQSHFVLHSSSINSTIDSSAASILSCQCESSQHMHE